MSAALTCMSKLPKRDAIRVLIVEDHDDAREMYATAAMFAGFEVRTAAHADAAFDLAVEWNPHVVITDFLLRGGPTGAELCRRLHEDARTGNIPTLVMTGSTRRDDAEAILGAGCADIRLKPYLPDAFIDDITRLTSEKAAEARRTA